MRLKKDCSIGISIKPIIIVICIKDCLKSLPSDKIFVHLPRRVVSALPLDASVCPSSAGISFLPLKSDLLSRNARSSRLSALVSPVIRLTGSVSLPQGPHEAFHVRTLVP
jgi:hypothetical protein